MRLRYIDYKCECGDITQILLDLNKQVAPNNMDCDACGEEAYKMFGAPAVLKASLPDGTNRGKTYDKLKEVAKVQKEMYNLPSNKRDAHKKQIKSLKDI